MKANSRRRVLISSVAMLLVAMVALGTSTYAWFTNATTAKANNLTVTANAAKGLQISTDGTNWGTNQTWADPEGGDTISPLSVPYTVDSVLPTAYYAKQAGLEGEWTSTKAQTATYEFASLTLDAPANYVNSEKYYLSYKVDTQVVGDTKGADDKWPEYALQAQVAYTGTGTDALKDVVRIAITDDTGKVYGVYGDEAVKAITSTTPDVATNASPVNNGRIDCGNVSGAARTLYVYLWIEGQDTECVDDLMSKTGSYNITFYAPDINA